tara:strand:+ start:36 stop:986 length:951 start_codon:yes stop_codon:yes gene_type:complete
MKKVKNYIAPDLAKKKLARYQFWSVKDENGIMICSVNENNPDGKTFSEVLDKIIEDNVDAEVQIKYGTNEQSARQNPPFFIKINEDIEWLDPEPEENITVNGVPHKVDKNGQVHINLTTPQEPKIETPQQFSTIKDELEMQLTGLRKEYELKEEKMRIDLQNKLLEQTLKFKEMMLAERENRLSEKEQLLAQKEAELAEKENQIRDDVKGYLKQIPGALGGLVKDFIKENAKKKESSLAGTETEQEPVKPKRKVQFQIEEEELNENEWEESSEVYEAPELDSTEYTDNYSDHDKHTEEKPQEINNKPTKTENDENL